MIALSIDDSQGESQQVVEERPLDGSQRESQRVVEEKNFPPLPSFCCVGPCFYHNIEAEIPVEFQKTCRIIFFLLKPYIVLLFLNCIAGCSTVCIDGGTMFGKSILYVILIPIMAFNGWYRPLYIAFRDGKPKYYMISFIVFSLQIILHLLWAIGGILKGTVAWRDAVHATKLTFTGKTVIVAIYFICAILWTLFTAIQMWAWIKILLAYDASVKARSEVQRAANESREGNAESWHNSSSNNLPFV